MHPRSLLPLCAAFTTRLPPINHQRHAVLRMDVACQDEAGIRAENIMSRVESMHESVMSRLSALEGEVARCSSNPAASSSATTAPGEHNCKILNVEDLKEAHRTTRSTDAIALPA